jgi:hypothetical protein
MRLPIVEFIRSFMLHLVPARTVRTLHYGLLGNRTRIRVHPHVSNSEACCGIAARDLRVAAGNDDMLSELISLSASWHAAGLATLERLESFPPAPGRPAHG